MVDCYVGIGGNFKNTFTVMREVVARLIKTKGISKIKISRLYRTTPVSPIAQPHYLNAVCRFQSSLSLVSLVNVLCHLEKQMGKKHKSKDAPRLIDLDLIFYGSLEIEWEGWIIPHPCWAERLFVLAPLADVTDTIPLNGGISLKQTLENFKNPHAERVTVEQMDIF